MVHKKTFKTSTKILPEEADQLPLEIGQLTQITPVNIQGLDIEMVAKYLTLGVQLNNKLDWTDNTDAQEGRKSPPSAEETEVLWGAEDINVNNV